MSRFGNAIKVFENKDLAILLNAFLPAAYDGIEAAEQPLPFPYTAIWTWWTAGRPDQRRRPVDTHLRSRRPRASTPVATFGRKLG
jgi:hypothetical protein